MVMVFELLGVCAKAERKGHVHCLVLMALPVDSDVGDVLAKCAEVCAQLLNGHLFHDAKMVNGRGGIGRSFGTESLLCIASVDSEGVVR